ncbi:MAG: polysaccharide biosynthesis tyrosine autokinase [Erysipelotrichaceae bacterium]|nr:polysaccharide biosynthesis tyrosine autokinase [Erysipelotrichaceae bacterium]
MNNQNPNTIIKITCILSSILRRWRTIILLMLISGISLDVISTITYTPQYVSTMQAVLNLDNNTYSQLEEARSYITTLNYILNGQVAQNYIKEELDVDSLDMTCSVYSSNDTNIITIQVYSSSKQISYSSLTKLIEWYNDNTDQYQFPYEIYTLEKTSLNETPTVLNNHVENFLKGSIIAGMAMIALLALLAYFTSNIKTPQDVEQLLDCRLFAKIPKEPKKRTKKFWKRNKNAILITSIKTSFQYKEAIKKLRSKVLASAQKHQYQTIMLTSTLENEGKSSIAANLALSIANSGKKVLLIDADIRKPSIHKIFAVKTKRSLNNYLEGEDWVNQIVYIQKHELFVMTAKPNLKTSEDLLSNGRFNELLIEAKKEFDYIIIDTSPSLDLNEPLLISPCVDAILLVVKQNEASAKMINNIIGRLTHVKDNLIGCIYNSNIYDFTKSSKTYGYRYGYNRYRRNEGR